VDVYAPYRIRYALLGVSEIQKEVKIFGRLHYNAIYYTHMTGWVLNLPEIGNLFGFLVVHHNFVH
jgi:hypothetical protein